MNSVALAPFVPVVSWYTIAGIITLTLALIIITVVVMRRK